MAATPRAVRSFDVFDTVLTRRVGAPTAVVDLLARELEDRAAVPVSAAAFARARKHYEGSLNRSLERPATLVEIYRAVAQAFSAEPSQAEAWAEEEENLERRLTVPIPGARDLVNEARTAVGSVIFVSDTPHRERFIRELLRQAGLLEADDLVFASAERGTSKARRGLYRLVADALPGASFTHVGDNRRVDVGGARVEGWAAVHRPAGQLTRYERLLGSSGSDLPGAWLAGASRLARLSALTRGTAPAIAEVASGVVAPTLVAYALWLAGQARLRGIQRLYFVARDGELMMRVAQPVFASVAPDIECRYLYGSRQPWTLAASAESDDVLRGWLAVGSGFTARTALGRVGLQPTDVDLPFCAPGRADSPLTAAERRQLADALLARPYVELVRAAARKTAEATVAYLGQEGLMDGTRSGLVDAGWAGRTARALDRVVRGAGGESVPQFIMGLFAGSRKLRQEGGPDLVPWLFDQGVNPSAWADFPVPNLMIEMFCAGTEGRLVSYETTDGGRVAPVLTQAENTAVLDWGLLEMRQVVVEAAELVAPNLKVGDIHADLTTMVRAVTEAFWTNPSGEEVKAWGSFPWEAEVWPPYRPIAQSLSSRQVSSRLRRGDAGIRSNSSWRAGSAKASAQPWRALLQARAWQLRHEARLRRIPHRVRLELALRGAAYGPRRRRNR